VQDAAYMKVLHIGKFFSPFRGGVENYMRDVMVALRRQGVACVAVVHRHERSFRSVDDAIPSTAGPVQVVRAGTWFKFMYTPFSPMFAVLIRRLTRLHRPDLLHIHMPNPSAFWALLLLGARRIPWVVHWHADVVASTHDPRLRWFYHLYRPFEQWLLRRAGAIIVTSQAYLEYSRPLRAHRHKCHVVPLGLDPARYPDAAVGPGAGEHHDADAPLRVLAIGRLTYYKGFEHLVAAAARAKQVQVDIVGTGDREKALRAQIVELGLDARVSLHGGLTDSRLHELLRQCDCICLPSIERTEAFGMVLLEAMLYGKPTVVSDVPGSGMGWVVEHGATGIKVESANPEALAHALNHLQEHRAEARAMGQRGRERFDREFNIDRSVASLVGIYQSLAGAATQQRN
jgi:glycosyltransferase involved in cell wall biosynthesis